MTDLNQAQIMAKRRGLNRLLVGIFSLLLLWVAGLAWQEFQRLTDTAKPLTAQHIRIERDVNTIILHNQADGWQITEPYRQAASMPVVKALLARLQHGCRALTAPPSRPPEFYARLVVDEVIYRVGELNAASDEVYVKQGESLFLCDKLLASMALAPAINFMDKQLYHGTLRAIIGDFGRLTDFSGVDLSVMEIAPADAAALPEHALSTLQFMAEDTRRYQAFLSDDSAHLLLFEPTQSVIYVIAANPKLNAVLGL